MGYAVSEHRGVAVLAIQGKMDAGFLPKMKEVVAGNSRVVVDLSQAVGLRGDDLENLVAAHHLCEKAGGRFALASLPSDLGYIMNLMELDEFFLIFPDLEGGVESLASVRPGSPVTTIQMIAMIREQILSESAILEIPDPEEAARERVKRVKTCIRYLAPTPERIELLAYLSSHEGPVDPETTAQDLARDREWVDSAFARLQGIRILVKKRSGDLVYEPAPQARASIRDILSMWADQGNRRKMMEWASAG